MLASNHVSFPDFVFVQQALLANRLVRFMCRADIWDTPPCLHLGGQPRTPDEAAEIDVMPPLAPWRPTWGPTT